MARNARGRTGLCNMVTVRARLPHAFGGPVAADEESGIEKLNAARSVPILVAFAMWVLSVLCS